MATWTSSCNDEPDRKLLYLNDGKGHFTEAGTFGDQTWSTRYVTLGDLNGDGYPDIVAANRPVLPPDPGPNLFVALQEQIGLKLSSDKGPVSVLIIDHVEKPTAN